MAASKTKSTKPKNGTKAKTASKTTRSRSTSAKTVAKAAPKQTRTKLLSDEVQGILLIALGLLLACTFYISAMGIVGEFVRNVCYGLFGAASSVFFVFFLLAGINCFREKKSENSLYKWWIIIGLMICSGMLYALALKDTSFVDGGFFANIRNLYDNGINGLGGGIIGGLICKCLVFLIGYIGAWICTSTATLVLLIILTGISIEALFVKIVNFFKASQNSIKDRMEREVEIDDIASSTGEREEIPAPKAKKPSLFKRIAARSAEKKARKAERAKHNQEEILPPHTEYKPIDIPIEETKPKRKRTIIPETETKPQRFVFEEDEELSQALKESLETNNKKDRFSIDDLPFDADNIYAGTISEEHSEFDEISPPEFLDTSKTGALTQIPNEDGTIPESDDTDDFEPPSQAKMEDKLDPMTKKALDSGVPLDEAVTKGRKMLVEQEYTPEEKIAAEIEEQKNIPPIVRYQMPSVDLLAMPAAKKKTKAEIKQELEEKANRLLDTLNSFKVEAKIINITQGPSVTRFELQPGFGVKVSKITGLSDDIALSLAAPGVRIEAPIPGKSAIGIEIPNSSPQAVPIREVLDTAEFRNKKSKTTVALGKDISGNCVIADIADFPHILIAGATGSGKSVCINSLITSILYKSKPNEVKMIMIDPKMVELGVYNGIPHLLIPVVTDPTHAAGALNWAVVEMQNRYNLLKDNKVRNLDGYNKLMDERGEPDAKLPEIVIIIDELADLMNVAKSEVEDAINRLAALARAAGMYLVIATQRPSVNVITGVIKANIPSRIAFAVSQQVDSRTIIDSAGAEKLLGKGDMLYSPRGALKPLRVQGNFVSDREIETLVDFIKGQYEAEYDEEVIEHIEKEHERVAADIEAANSPQTVHSGGGNNCKVDDMFIEAAELVLENGQASVAMFQRKFKMGYQRAAKLIDQMEELKIIGPYEGTKPRQVLITRQELNEMKYNRASE